MDVPATASRNSLRQFFYRGEAPYSLALLRIVLPLVLLQVIVPRWFHARELFSADGAAAPLALNYGVVNFPPEPGGTLAVAMMTALVVSLCSASIGWKTRPSLLIAFVLYTYLNALDCLGTLTKYSVISSHLLLLLSVSPCGAVWSIDGLHRRRAGAPVPACPVWSRRLIQLFVGLVYLGAASTKLHTTSYFSSDQLRYWLMSNVNNANPVGEWLSFFPAVVIVMAHVAIVWQTVFVFLVWKPAARPIVLGLGVFFHAATAPLLGLYIFPQVMIASYLAFLSGPEAWSLIRPPFWQRQWHRLCERLAIRWRLPAGLTSGVVWIGLLVTTTLAGVAAESLQDPYGLRRPDGPHQLRPVSAELEQQLRAAGKPIPFVDRILTFDIGTQMLGGVILDSPSKLRRGQSFLVQLSLAPPHSDVWLSCQLADLDGHVLHQVGQVVPRSQLRADWQFQVPGSWPAGLYAIELRYAGETVARKEIDLQ